jgi:CheY-like chemotaxis protein
MSILPIYKCPTKILLIDDNKRYLENLHINLEKSDHTYSLFNNPLDALEYLNIQYEPDYWTDRFITQSSNPCRSYEEWNLNFQLYHLPLEIYNPKRFEQISCIVVDYSMPGMNGIELCRKIKNPFIKKILLTGDADEQIAVEAFNSGIIDYFIPKATPLVYQKLDDAIKRLSIKYFVDLSSTAYNIVVRNNLNTSALIESNFSKLLRHNIKKYNIVEYYLFESFGCYIMLDAKGKSYGFFIYPESDIKDVLDDIKETSSWRDFFNSSPKIMCYHKMKEPNFPQEEEKKKYLQKATLFDGENNKYYWVITDKNLDIEKNKIVSFSDFKGKFYN